MKLFVLTFIFILTSCKNEIFIAKRLDYKTTKGLNIEELQGEDKNNDGVRDDIEAWLDNNIKNKNLQNAFRQVAQFTNKSYEYLENKEKSIYYQDEIGRSGWCVVYAIEKIDHDILNAGNELSGKEYLLWREVENKVKMIKKRKDISKEEALKLAEVEREKARTVLKPLQKQLQPAEDIMDKQNKKRMIQRGQFNRLLINTDERKRAGMIRRNHGAGNMFIMPGSFETACKFKFEY